MTPIHVTRWFSVRSTLILSLAMVTAVLGAAYDLVTLASQDYQHVLRLSVMLTTAAIMVTATGFALTRSLSLRAIYILIFAMSAAVLANALSRLAPV